LSTGTDKKYSNRLKSEQSPYLLQHADNPVDWYPWGREAFLKAKKENKPVFLSIGYSTCHWCHVMEHESFENPRIAEIMNQNFVSIKVDREERPDVDNIYMQAVVGMTGSGGWPLSVFLTPDEKPFFGGTYFPPEDRYGRPGFKSLLLTIAEAWKTRPAEIQEATKQVQDFLNSRLRAISAGEISEKVLKDAYHAMASGFDSTHGGFGQAPKFPMSHNLSFLLTYWYRYDEAEALRMAEKTLRKMAGGGMYDHLGGGFHRYSTDQYWLVPHFEKMLYDQAILSRTYWEAYQVTGNQFYARLAEEIFEYVLRDMTHPEGGFYSAEDADSEGKEGKFYVWKPEEIKEVLGQKEGELFCQIFDVTESGNFEGTESILHLQKSPELLAKIHNLTEEQLQDFLNTAKAKLFQTREKRIHPHKDDKILTDWNGLMIASLAYGYSVWGDKRYLRAAERSADFILDWLQKNGRLLKHYRGQAAEVLAYLDDYAFFIHGLIDLYQASFNPRWLKQATRLTDDMLKLFWDQEHQGFLFTGRDGEKLITQTKEIYDGAVPSGNSLAIYDLLRLGKLTMRTEYLDRGEASLKSFMGTVSQSPASYSQMLMAVDFYLGPSQEVVIAGDPDDQGTQEMLRSVRTRFIPRKVLLFHPTGSPAREIEKLVPYTQGLVARDGKATAYVCQDFVCQLPTTDLRKMEELLAKK
jgi:uncharacterized protein YyaL (SSP411 family)